MKSKPLTADQAALLADIVGQAELAELLGESRGLLSMWIKDSVVNGFPRPVLTLRAGRFFRRTEVLEWYAEYRERIPAKR